MVPLYVKGREPGVVNTRKQGRGRGTETGKRALGKRPELEGWEPDAKGARGSIPGRRQPAARQREARAPTNATIR